MTEDVDEWEIKEMCAGGDFTVVHGRPKHGGRSAQTWITGNLSHGRFCFSSCVLDRLTPLPALAGAAVRSMSCGRAHTLLATDNGSVYSWGWNIYGQLGHGNSADVYAPTQLEYFRKAGAVAAKVCCGEGFSIVVCSEGLYSFGCNHKGQLGVGYAWATSHSNTPQRVCLDAEELASGYSQKAYSAARLDVACGGNHTIVLRVTGPALTELFSWGLNSDGQCGVGDLGNLSQLLQPARVVIPPGLAADGPRSIACGLSHSIILSQAGHVYSFGDGSQGQLGLGTAASMLIPTRVACLEGGVSKVICGYAHTMCVTEHADAAFAWGTNLCGELGNGNGAVRCSLEPQLMDLTSFSGVSIGAIGSGPCANHSLMLTSRRLPWPMTRVLLAVSWLPSSVISCAGASSTTTSAPPPPPLHLSFLLVLATPLLSCDCPFPFPFSLAPPSSLPRLHCVFSTCQVYSRVSVLLHTHVDREHSGETRRDACWRACPRMATFHAAYSTTFSIASRRADARRSRPNH